MRSQRPNLDRMVLLVIDMQEHFRGLAKPLLKRLPPLLQAFRDRSVPILFTRHGYDYPDTDGGLLAEWWDDHILVGTPAWEFLPEVAPLRSETVIPKKRYSAFQNTNLEPLLRKMAIRDVAIAGVMTNLCCETTARDAFVRDFRVFFLSDGTATVDRAMHRASLLNLEYGFATILTCAELESRCRVPGPW